MEIDSSNWSAEFLACRPRAVDAIKDGLKLLNCPADRTEEVAEDLYIACVQHGRPIVIAADFVEPREIRLAVERIVKAAETIEESMQLLERETHPLPPTLGKRPLVVSYLHQEIVRALNERLVPWQLTEGSTEAERDKILPHLLPRWYWQSRDVAHHPWRGRFSEFASTVSSIADYAFNHTGKNSLRRPANKLDYKLVLLVAELAHIFERETGQQAKAYRKRDAYHDKTPGEEDEYSDFAVFVMALWDATEHQALTIDSLMTACEAARTFPT